MNLLEANISIPRLQRDYVQGINESIIRPFINDLMNVSNTVDLNYIYGTKNKEYFQPIDGQQRLTTIWLLRLCLSKIAGIEFNVSLQYDTREYANEYCKQLLLATVEDVRKPEQAAWYLKAWDNDYSVCAMNSAIDVIWKYMPNTIEDVQNILHSLDTRLQYCYLPLGEDINEDIYIKMNRRGVQLSAFENLKSWLDKRAEVVNKSVFSKEWKERMDGSWSTMMWDLVDKSDTEKDICIDDLMLNCIYSFAYCYLSKNKDEFNRHFDDNENEKQNARFILDLQKESDIYESCLERIGSPKNKKRLELYQLDVLPIFTGNSMHFIYNCMERLCNVYKAIDDSSYNFYREWRPSTSESLLVHLVNENTYQSRTLLFALSAFIGSESTSFDSWIYRIRNLVVNSDINAATINNILLGIESLAKYCKDASINDVLLLRDKNDNGKELFPLIGFSKKQLQEESTKSKLNLDVWNEVKATENHHFFLGRVSFLFDFAGENPSLEKINPYTFYMQELFNNNSFANDIGNSLRLAMLPFGWFGYHGQYGNWSFLKSKEEKQKFIYDNDIDIKTLFRDTPHNYVLQKVIEQLYNKYGFVLPTSDMLQQIAKALYDKIPVNDSRKYFSYIEIWNQMGQHQLRSNGETIKLLFEKTKGNCYRIDLWNYRLYIDWTNSLNEDSLKKHETIFPGWKFDKWAESGESCVYLEKRLSDNEKLAINIWHDPNEYDWFGISIFIRENAQKTIELLGPILENAEFGYVLNNDGDRYSTTKSISRGELEKYLIDIIEEIGRIL